MKLGDKVQFKINSEFTGVVYGITDYVHGCRRVGVRPFELKDGRPQDTYWFDEPELEVAEEDGTDIPLEDRLPVKRTGGPRPEDGTSLRHDPH